MTLADFAAEKGLSTYARGGVVKRYVGPVLTMVAVLVLWTFTAGPWLSELRADLAFLRVARYQAIQAQQQRQQAPAAPVQGNQP